MRFPQWVDAGALTLLAGIGGAIASVQFIRNLTVMQRVLMVFTGFIMSIFLTEPISHWVQMPANAKFGIAFLIGLFGWTVAGKMIVTIKHTDLHALLKD